MFLAALRLLEALTQLLSSPSPPVPARTACPSHGTSSSPCGGAPAPARACPCAGRACRGRGGSGRRGGASQVSRRVQGPRNTSTLPRGGPLIRGTTRSPRAGEGRTPRVPVPDWLSKGRGHVEHVRLPQPGGQPRGTLRQAASKCAKG